jgi:glutamate/tyrosine decarboxylase-like PLP-dependent enzyme
MPSITEKMQSELALEEIFEQATEYALNYINNIGDQDPFPSPLAIAQLSYFNESLPTKGIKSTEILKLLHTYGSPATTAQTGGRYFGFVTGGAIPVALASKWLTDVWDQNSGLYLMSPVASTIEAVTETWLREIFDLDQNVVASFLSGTSMAIVCGLAAARYRIFKRANWDFNHKGHNGGPVIRIVAGDTAHGAVIKAISLLGFGIDNIEWVDTDDQGRLILGQLPELDDKTIVVLQAGNVNTGAFDPIQQVCKRANEAGAWVHIDGAFGLWAAASSDLKHLTRGMKNAQSWSVDGHKTLNTPYDNGILLCADKQALHGALQSSGSYLAYSEQRDGMLYTPEMSRRARAIELWATLKYLGKHGVDELVTGLHRRATQFAEQLRANNFQVLNEVVFNQIIVGFEHNDIYTQKIVEHIQASGDCWVGSSTWQGKVVIRISICSWATTSADVCRSVTAFIKARNSLAA